jgi:hypothetical protein
VADSEGSVGAEPERSKRHHVAVLPGEEPGTHPQKLDNVVILLKDMCEAQAQLDNFMREYMSAPPCMELVGKTVEKQM